MIDRTNRRKRTRFTINIEALYLSISRRSNADWMRCTIYNFNYVGVGIRSNQVLVVNDKLLLKIGGNAEANTFEMIVVGVNGQKIGLKFLRINENQEKLLTKLSLYNVKQRMNDGEPCKSFAEIF